MSVTFAIGEYVPRLGGPGQVEIDGWTYVSTTFRVQIRDEPELQIDVDIDVEFDPDLGRISVMQVTGVRRPDGPDVSNLLLRAVRVREYVDRAAQYAVVGHLREPNDEVLAYPLHMVIDTAMASEQWERDKYLWTWRVYRFAQIFGANPAKLVEQLLHLTSSTATRWIRRARERGYFDPGKARG